MCGVPGAGRARPGEQGQDSGLGWPGQSLDGSGPGGQRGLGAWLPALVKPWPLPSWEIVS